MKILCLFKHKWKYSSNIFGDIFRDCERCGRHQLIKLARISLKEQREIAEKVSLWEESS